MVYTTLNYYPDIFMDVLRKTVRRLNHIIRYSYRDSNHVSRTYKSEVHPAKT